VLRLRAEHGPLRCVAWQPDAPETTVAAEPAAAGGAAGAGGGAVAGGRCFLTASQSGDLRIWDPRDPFSPAASRSFYNVPITSCVWASNPGAIVLTQSDGGPKVVFASVTGIGSVLRNTLKPSAMILEGAGRGGQGGPTLHLPAFPVFATQTPSARPGKRPSP
jgi:WD40 repeat protein